MLEEDNSQTGNNSASDKSPDVANDEFANEKSANLAEAGADSAYLTPNSSDDPETIAAEDTEEQQVQQQADNGETTLGTPALLQVPNDGMEEQITETPEVSEEQNQGPSLEQRLADSVAISAPKATTSQQSNNIQRTSSFSANPITIGKINYKNITANTLGPREQEAADEPVLRGIHHLFNNRFSQAKKIFEDKADQDPLYSLGLGSMAFLIAAMVSQVVPVQGKQNPQWTPTNF
jgi:hypothetical protein